MTAFFVSPLGRDHVTGTIEHPFRTIKEATLLAMDGDTVFLRGGTFRERVTLITPGVTLSAYPIPGGYEPVTLDGEYRLPDTPVVPGGTNKDGTWLPFNYSGLLELFADRTAARGITVMRSLGRGLEVGGLDDLRRTTGNVIEDCQTLDHRHCGLGGKYFNNLTVRRHKNSGTGNFADFRRQTGQGVPFNHAANCSFQVGNGLVIEGLESSGGWGEAIMFNNIIHGTASGLKVWDCMTGGIYINACGWLTIDGWTSFYNDVGRLPAGGEIQAGLFINRENHKSDWGALENVCHDIVVANGLSVNNDRGISLLGALGLFPFSNISFVGNTIVRPSWRPKAGQSSALFVAGQGKFKNILFDHNLIQLTDPAIQMPVTAPPDPNIHWGPNFWSHKPPVAQRNAGDVYGDTLSLPKGDAGMVNAGALIASGNINVENYRLRPGSIAAGFGALQPPPLPPAGGGLGGLSGWRTGVRAGARVGVG